jgi:YidC/Oxa1 family membrane protein insertase
VNRRALLAVAFLLLPGLGGVKADTPAATTVETSHLRLTFDAGGNLSSAIACFPACTGERVRVQQFASESVIAVEGGGRGAAELSDQRREAHYELRFARPGGVSLTWKIPESGYRLGLEVAGGEALLMRSGEPFRPRPAAGFGNWLEQTRYLAIDGGDVTQTGLDEDESSVAGIRGWLGYRNRYWSLMAQPPAVVDARLATGAEQQGAEVRIDAPADGEWSFYLGPVEPVMLKTADPVLQKVLYAGLWFWLRWISLGLFHLLAAIQQFIPAWGIAIMALSLAVNVLMLPLSRLADRFQQEVNEVEARLAPELQRIKKHFKGEEQAAKIIALYKTERVHPLYSLKSLVGVAVVIPVFIGAFDMLAENIHLLNTGFLWIADLSRPDDLFNLPFRLPFFGAEFNLLPFLMTALSFVASVLHKPLALNAELRHRQVRNMILLALAFFVLFYTFPAGMVLYWTTNNLISVIKSLWARR